MQNFYMKALAVLGGLLLVSMGLVYLGYRASQMAQSLFPLQDHTTPWVASFEPQSPANGAQLQVRRQDDVIDYDFVVSPSEPFSYTAYVLDFLAASENTAPVDFSAYRAISFDISCAPKNILLLAVLTVDYPLAQLQDTSTHRVSSSFFTCDSERQTVTIPFDEITTPDWWLQQYDYSLTSERVFSSSKVTSIRFVNSLQSPRATHSAVEITRIRLLGERPVYTYIAILVVIALWLAYFIWIARRYVVALVAQSRAKVRQDLPIVAYQKLSIAPHKDKDRSAVLQLMATEYANSELSVEMVVNRLGLNRHKINEILKSELGLTFSTYLNKLRLTEAARLLAEAGDVTISEVAYAVGYNNVSYFNRLFKAEYGCSPKMFKNGSQTL